MPSLSQTKISNSSEFVFNKDMVLYIPVVKEMDESNIKKIFMKEKIGNVSRVDIIRKGDINTYNGAFVYFEYWHESNEAQQLQKDIYASKFPPYKSAYIIHNEKLDAYWICKECTNPISETQRDLNAYKAINNQLSVWYDYIKKINEDLYSQNYSLQWQYYNKSKELDELKKDYDDLKRHEQNLYQQYNDLEQTYYDHKCDIDHEYEDDVYNDEYNDVNSLETSALSPISPLSPVNTDEIYNNIFTLDSPFTSVMAPPSSPTNEELKEYDRIFDNESFDMINNLGDNTLSPSGFGEHIHER
tara:strand:- start:238 stop:1140 length:903 start_codon:yes stop_codon:yes gene_type:complete